MAPSCDNLLSTILKYNPNSNLEMIKKAYQMCIQYHEGQFRKSGDPYSIHPINVAEQIVDMKLDDISIIAAFLHDTLEDTILTKDIIEREFSKEIADIIDGITKLDKIKFQLSHVQQAENFRKLFLALSRDIRVIIVKLCDRLHNMQTINHHKSKSKVRQIAAETLEIYAPLAERIGMYKMRDELQDISFSVLNPRARGSVLRRLNQFKSKYFTDENTVQSTIQELELLLKKHGIKNFVISGREKTPYSVWKKLMNKEVSFENMSDIMGFRVIVYDIEDCYRVLGAIHRSYRAVPGSFTDYISVPKINGYESIHTTVFGPCKKIEIQIRTKKMDAEAEYGLAAHWMYKQGKSFIPSMKSGTTMWIQSVLQILEDSDNAREFLEATKLEMYQEEVFIFTPHGDIISLRKDASIIDVAFAIHNDFGLFCNGAKVNGKLVDISYRPTNGDQVKILTSGNIWPKSEWLNIAITGKAQSAIRFATKQEMVDQIKARGQDLISAALKKYKITPDSKVLKQIMKSLHRKNIEGIYLDVGNHAIDIVSIVKTLYGNEVTTSTIPHILSTHINNIVGLDSRLARHIAMCCTPDKSDQIIGIISPNDDIAIHAKTCPIYRMTYISNKSAVVELGWQ